MKYCLIEKKYGRFKRIEVKSISDKKAKELESDGHETFNSYKEANEHKRGLK